MLTNNYQVFRRTSGFTIIELLVALAVISILVAIIIPSVVLARHRSYDSVCLSNLRQLGIATQSYASDYDNRFPSAVDAKCSKAHLCNVDPQLADVMPSYTHILFPYTKTDAILRCPSDDGAPQATGGIRHPHQAFAAWGSSYQYNDWLVFPPLDSDSVIVYSNPSTAPLYSDYYSFWHYKEAQNTGQETGYINVVYLDNHAARVPFVKWLVQSTGKPTESE